MVSAIVRTTMNTWSPTVHTEACFVGHIRPGDVYFEVWRCRGKTREEGSYVDWRLNFYGFILTVDPVSMTVGSLVGNVGSGLIPAIFAAGGALGVAAGRKLADHFYDHVVNSTFLTTMLMAGATATPLLGAAAAAAGVLSLATFKGVCTTFIAYLTKAGVLGGMTGIFNIWGLRVQVLVVGSNVYRQKRIQLSAGPDELVGNGTVELVKYERYNTFAVENWNQIITPTLGLPGVVGITAYAKLDLAWDITPWFETLANKNLERQNQKRIDVCVRCLEQGMAFCDWRGVLGSLWKPKNDNCDANIAERKEACTRPSVELDHSGKQVRGEWYDVSRGSSSCQGIPFPLANKDIPISKIPIIPWR